jgi:hypothetical protein
MDLGNPSTLISGALIGLVGMALFVYGRRSQEPKCLGAGIAMCVFPIFVSSLLLMWLLAGLCVLGAYALPKTN